MTTKITILPGNRLTPDHVQAWSSIQQDDPDLESPFFRPEFTRLVAEVRGNVEVAVLEEDGQLAGFFPFQRGFWRTGGPVGGKLNDFQGVVARRGLDWSADELIRACGLSSWSFDHLLPSQQPFLGHHFATGNSPFMDVSARIDDLRAVEPRNDSRTVIRELPRKLRKVEREVGPVRFELHTDNKEVFATLLRWKSEQYRRTRVTDVFAYSWTVQLLERILQQREESFAGMLSALYFGDRLAAVELMIRSRDVLHGWFPAYDQELGKYSPGMILVSELARAMPSHGLRRYHMGKGETRHKNTFATGAISLATGSVSLNPLGRLVRQGWQRTRALVRRSRLLAPARLLGRWTRPLRGWLAFR
jgi:CelD/BcsL family acetyltransferase involved in cellulose biosynthesis